jgi:putative transposase
MQCGYRYRFYPTFEQAQILAQTFGCVRYVYNWALRLRIDAWQAGVPVTYEASSAALTELKKGETTHWLNDVSSVPIQQSLRHLQTAFSRVFDKIAKFPTFKKKEGRQSAEYSRSAFNWDPDTRTLTIAKLGVLKIKWSRNFKSTPSTVTLSKDPAGRYFVSLRLDETVKEPPQPISHLGVGIDFGINRTMTLSNGERIDNPRYTAKYEKRLEFLQRRLSRKQKGSANRTKAKLKVAKLHSKIADCRKDFTQKATTRIVRENQAIYLEDLSVRNMMANHKLAKAIGDCGWYEISRQLTYKSSWYARTLVKIDRFYPSSKRCSACGYTIEKLPLDVRGWQCPDCATEHDRDENAAKNILAAGQAVSVSRGTIRPKRTPVRRGASQRRRNSRDGASVQAKAHSKESHAL